MKFLGLERDNTTFKSTPDPVGFAYSASFELYPFHEGRANAVYKGILNGTGPRRGDFCVVKARVDTDGQWEDWKFVRQVTLKAQGLAASFNTHVQPHAIAFESPMVAEMQAVSDFIPIVRLFKPHCKKLHKGEMVLIENFVEGTFHTFNSSFGWVNPGSKMDVTQAFSHYTWHATRDLVVCGLQGVTEGHGVRLTTPVIHSTCCKYGKTDGGLEGIKEFFASHRCNNICSSWYGLDVPHCKPRVLKSSALHVHSTRRSPNPRRNDNNYGSSSSAMSKWTLI